MATVMIITNWTLESTGPQKPNATMLVENYVELNFSQFANRKNGKYEINFIFLTNIFFLLSDSNLYVLFAPPLFHVDFLKDMGYRWIIHNAMR